MPRVVLDTNVVVSAHLNPAGLERAVLNWALEQGFFVSEPTLKEYGDVLRRTKFKIDSSLAAESLGLIRARATLVSPTRKVTVSRDPDDNRFLECAEAADADYFVTGNKRHFPANYKRTRVVDASSISSIRPHNGGCNIPAVPARQFRRVCKGSLNIGFLEGRITLQKLFVRYACGQVIQNHRNHNARTADTRLAMADKRVDADAFPPLEHFYILSRSLPGKGAC